MAKVHPHLLAFNRGEVSRLALARVDLGKLQLAAECQLNWQAFALGPMMVRPGLAHVGGIAGDNPCVLIDFVYSKSDTAMIELTHQLMRVWIDDALVTRPSVTTTIGDPNMTGSGSWSTAGSSDGTTVDITGGVAVLAAEARGGLARMSQTLTIASGDQNKEHGLRITVTNGPVTLRAGSSAGLADYIAQTALDTGTHSIPFTPTGASVVIQIESADWREKRVSQVTLDPPGVLTLPTPFTTALLPTIRWTGSGDIIYLAQYGGQQCKIERRGVRPGARGWSVVLYRSNNGPFLNGPSIDATMKPTAHEGNGFLETSRPFFTPQHVGALFRLFTAGQSNFTTLGAENTYSDPIRVAGVNADRVFAWFVGGTWSGKVTLQRSFVGPDSGFVDVASTLVNATTGYDDSQSLPGPPQVVSLNNVVAWYRIGIKAGEYTSGTANVGFVGSPGAATAGGRYGICRVTGYNSPTQVAMEVIEPFSDTVASVDWQEGAWSPVQGHPTSVALQEGRLWWFGAPARPVAGSQSDNYTGFATANRFGEGLGDAGAILRDFGEGPADRVNWALPLSRLLAGREGSIGSIRSSSFDTPLTPTDCAIKDCSQQGADRLRAIKRGKRGIFVQAAGTRVYELYYSPQAGDYEDRDLSRFNPGIGSAGFVDIASATQPDTVVYLVRGDGQLACLLYDPNDEIECWGRFQTLGVIENVCVLPRATRGDDRVYVVVRRVVNGQTRRFREVFSQRSENAGGTAHRGLDCHVVYSGAPATSITLAHLPNTTVTVWADGRAIGTGTTDGSGVLSPLPDGQAHSVIVAGLAGGQVNHSGDTPISTLSGFSTWNGIPGEFFADQQPSGRMVHVGTLTPAGGSVTLPNGMRASRIVGYFGFMAPFMSAKLAYGAQAGSPLTQTKKIDHVGLVMSDAHPLGLQVGQSFDRLDPLPLVVDGASVDPATIWREYDEPMISLPGEWDTDARLCLLGRAPYPCTVGATVVSVKTNG